jgi:drug/metabolite transporter (DMT)-like permease
MMLLGWVRGGAPPSGRGAVGLLFGMAGVTLLVNPWGAAAGRGIDPLGATVLILAALVWAAGSLYSRGAALPASQLLATGMEMLAGGALLLVAGLASGEAAHLDLARVSLRSSLSLAYLVVFGALIGYTAYLWLLRVTTPSRASTYAFVNPLVAVLLGWAIGGESISPRTLAAAGIIVAGVVLIVTSRRAAPASAAPRHADAAAAACNAAPAVPRTPDVLQAGSRSALGAPLGQTNTN